MSKADAGGVTFATNHKFKDLDQGGFDSDSDAEPEPDSDQNDAPDSEVPEEANPYEEEAPRKEEVPCEEPTPV